jgi:homoserine dehydrogenase
MAKIALLGIGTVGTGVAEILRGNAAEVARGAREPVELKYILMRRAHPESDFSDKAVSDFSVIENDPEISVVAECMGGVGDAYDYAARALRAGKSVVTSNKELVAERGLELLALAKEKRVSFLFEGSVGGGIPVIRPLMQCLAGNRISEVCGILNGTTNYILTQMLQCARSFGDVLLEAQRLGYAEADPSADVDGIDAKRKICILADLCFGKNVDPSLVKAEGIRGVTPEDAAFAGTFGCTVKLLGRAVLTKDGRELVYVAPHLVPDTQLLSNVNGVMNGIMVRGNAVGECMFYGPGAGKLPTGSAVVADIMDAVRHEDEKKYIDWGHGEPDMLVDPDSVESRWYVRAPLSAAMSLKRGGCDVSASSLECAAITPKMLRRDAVGLTEGCGCSAIFRVLD